MALIDLIKTAVEEALSTGTIDFDALVDKAFKEETADGREALAKKQIRHDIGLRLRKWALAVEQPMIPDLLDGYVEKDGDYIHASQLSREEWLVRKRKIRARINTLLLREAAIDEMLSQDLPSEGEIA
jgi:hypothetical protein